MSRPVEVTLLTEEQCTFCEVAKQILHSVGRDYPLRVREVELASPEGRQLAAAGGVLFAPGVLLDGQPFSYGRLSERKLRRALQLRATEPEDRLHSS